MKTGIFRPGEAQQGIVALSLKTFDRAIQDVANPLWMIEFHAPWCGVCQRFAPTLETVAEATSGRMAIATVDCTLEVALCKQRFQIASYPTLMYAHYGSLEDFPLQHDRPVEDYVDFARRMSLPAVSNVTTMDEALRFTKEQGVNGVVFVVHHPSDENEQSGVVTMFKQVSMRLQRYTSFLILQPSKDSEAKSINDEKPLICRLEDNVPMRCYDQAYEKMELNALLEWVQLERIPTVSRLTASSLNELGKRGQKLCIVIYQLEDQAVMAEETLKRFATQQPSFLNEKVLYGSIEYPKYKRYLEHLGFEVDASNSPQLFLIDMATKEYWQNATYGLEDIGKFFKHIESGIVPSQSVRKIRNPSLLRQVKSLFQNNRPWSYLLVVGQGVAFFTLLYQFVKVRESLRPPYQNRRRQRMAQGLAAECTPFVPRDEIKTKKEN